MILSKRRSKWFFLLALAIGILASQLTGALFWLVGAIGAISFLAGLWSYILGSSLPMGDDGVLPEDEQEKEESIIDKEWPD